MKINKIISRLRELIIKRPKVAAGTGIALLVILILILSGGKSSTEDGKDPLWTVKRGSLTINVQETGALKNKDEIILKNDTEQGLKITYLVAEGTSVTNGQLLVELESDTLEQSRDTNELNVKRLESDLARAEADQEILKSQQQSNVDDAEKNLKFAKIDKEELVKGTHPKSLATAKANLKTTQENLSQMESIVQPNNLEIAEANLALTKENLEKAIEGTHPNQLQQAQANLMIAEERLERAKDDCTWSEKLHDKGFITLKELKADRLALKQAEISLTVSQNALTLLTKYTHPQSLTGLRRQLKQDENTLTRMNTFRHPQDLDAIKRQLAISEINLEMLTKYTIPKQLENAQTLILQNERRLARTKLRAKASVSGTDAQLFGIRAGLNNAQKELQKSEKRLVACKIIAPANGMIVHGTTGRSRWDERDLMEVGANVHPRQKLIRMPTSDRMVAEIRVPEASKPKLRINMPAVIAMEALPDQTFKGRLTKMGILPDSSQSWLNPDLKVYKCEIELDEAIEGMRPGMNCKVDIVLEQHTNALFVPIQCVLQIDGKPTVYVKTRGGSKKRVVQTGMDNNVMIHILAGLEEGEQVLQNPPLDEAMKKDLGPVKAAPDKKPMKGPPSHK